VKRKESTKKVQRAKVIAEVKSVKVGILERGNRGFTILVSENSEMRERGGSTQLQWTLKNMHSDFLFHSLFFSKRDTNKDSDLTFYN